jgi:hypothetical protein
LKKKPKFFRKKSILDDKSFLGERKMAAFQDMIFGGLFFVVVGAIIWFLVQKNKTPPTPRQDAVDTKIENTNNQVENAPVENGQVSEVEGKIDSLKEKAKEVETGISEREKEIAKKENAPVNSEEITDPEKAAEWVNKITNKTAILLFLVLFPFSVFAAEPVYKGKPITPKYNGVILSLEEINTMKIQIEEGNKAQDLNKEYVALLEEYRKLKTLQQNQIEQMATLDKLKQESIVIYRDSVVSYKNIIEEMRKNNIEIEKKLGQQRRTSRWKRNLNFFLGFIAPIAGAKAIQSIK